MELGGEGFGGSWGGGEVFGGGLLGVSGVVVYRVEGWMDGEDVSLHRE